MWLLRQRNFQKYAHSCKHDSQFYENCLGADAVKNTDKQFYLVEKEGKQFFVTVTDEFIETRQMAKQITDNKFEIGN